MRLARRLVPAMALGLLGVLLLVVLATPALAEGDDTTAPAERTGGLVASELEKRLFEDPTTAFVLLLLRFGPILIGIVLVVRWYLRRDKIRGGMLPPPVFVEPTVPFNLAAGLVLAGLAFVASSLVIVILTSQFGWKSAADIPVWAMVTAMAIGTVPVGVIIAVRRRRMATTPPEMRVTRAGFFSPPAGAPVYPSPRMGRAFGLGAWGLCIASLVVIPVTLGWVLLLEAFGYTGESQALVQQMVDSPSPLEPWLIAGFGVLIAPFTEECIFRGLLYPAIKRVSGGGNRGAWISAIIISAAFAMVHDSWVARIPLFVLAMVLARIFEKTNSLAAVIFLHALHNLFSTVPLLLLWYSK